MREWGPWSVWKTEILLGGYLPLFAQATKKADHRTFIDCFAGVSRNVERDTGREIKSSPRQALEAEPPFTHLLGFELPDNAEKLEADLSTEFPGRAICIIGGDCNEKITEGLRWWFDQRDGLRGPYLGPALAYLDPDSLELAWSTVETIANFGMTPPEPGSWTRQKGPVELLILFPTGPLKRTLPQAGKKEATDSARAKVDRLFGDDSWQPIYADQRAAVTTGEHSWSHYVNLYRYKLATLGYSHTAAVEVRNTKGVVLYHMVFATGHVAGKSIMSSLMARASEVLPRLLDEEKRRRRMRPAEDWLFDDAEAAELKAAAADPRRYARLLTEHPSPYTPGQSAPMQLELDWSN